MIPRLYETNEAEFTSLGIGELADATSCKVTEERNGSYELELEYPESGKLFDEITVGRIVLAKPSDTAQAQPFKIYSISKPLSGTITVNAEHVSYLLSGIPVKPFTATGINAALAGIKSNAMVDCPFTFWTDISNGTSPYSVTVPQSARACLGGMDGSILDTFGGEFEWDRWMVKSHLHRGTDSGVTIEYGKNLTDLKQDESIEELYTGCIAYWKPSNDGSVVNGNIQYIENHSNYPHERIFIYDASSDFQEAPTVDQLNTRAAKYITDNSLGTPKVNLTVSFVALWQTEEYKEIAPLERVSLCDTVHVNYPKLGVTASAKVIKTTYDTLMERYDSIELGDAKSSMADAIKQSLGVSGTVSGMVKQSSSFLEAAISTATKLIQGGLGGHVVIGTNADGEPNEIIVMDTEDKATAKNVIRINENGIGFSTSGYNGPFKTAWTIDGHFNADWIDTGTLNGNLIKGGTIVAGSFDDDVSESITGAVKSIKIEFAQNQSSTTAPTSGWDTTAPEWKDGYYMWQRTTTTKNDGTSSVVTTCISGATGAKGATGPRGLQGLQGPKGDQGIQGPQGKTGATGASAYTHIAYATSADGSTGFSVSDSAGKTYIGMYADHTSTDSTSPSSYKWTLIKGEKGDTGAKGATGPQGPKGDQGIPGKAGADGKTPYLHMAYANSADGKTNFNVNYFPGALYVGTYTDYAQADSTNYSAYVWARLKGDKGDTGAKGATGTSVASTVDEWYLSTSSTSLAGGSWSSTIQTWSSGKYYWRRLKTIYSDGTTKYTPTANGYYDAAKTNAVSNATTAQEAANSASSTASNAQTTANDAQNTASSAKSTADTALAHADSAASTARDASQAASNVAEVAKAAQAAASSAQTAADNATQIANGASSGLQSIKQVFYADSTGAHVKAANGNETVTQSDGMHLMVGGSEVAKFTKDDTHITNVAVSDFFMVGAHRVEMQKRDGVEGTAFFWIGDVK